MKTEMQLKERSGNKCELCEVTGNLNIYEVPPVSSNEADREIYICNTCLAQIDKKEELDSNHWQCLSSSMWSEVAMVKVVAWRMLNRFRNESWAADNLDMMYLEEELLELAKATGDHISDGSVELHKDCNGNILSGGDTVTLIKDLDVKGSSINAKIGTAVRNIRLVHDNVEQIEGKIDGQMIVILTKFVKKQ
ncbi:PhnA domain-containing protein [Myroides indicus]|jgi:protein PhnA|uniref:Alkylphosphonate utilization operon protein PhnA n=1 Tax=Myroides indicus TaxID=1323422 RepID=A0A4R7ELN5_9FLAO|nr:alkylphosphonate utilization protein [Myroides indicus]TDS51102.1 alkylphosphonate utilization operon protein PhnA [Myroides indicus]